VGFFLWRHLKSFMLQFGLVWNLRMCWKFFQCPCLKISWIGSFSFADVNNVPKQLVATLVLGSRLRQRGCKSAGQEEAWGSHHIGSGEWESVREWTLTLPRQLPFWEMESRWTSEILESNFRGQNSMACDVLYIIGNLLELRCLKWARIVHLDI